MQLSMQARAVPRLATVLLVVVLLVAAVVAIAIVGSTRRLPNPFGLAANGRVAYLANGQIYAADPDGSNPIPLTFGVRSAATPEWSRDGTKFAYTLISPKPGTDRPTKYGDIVVANADGSNPITIDRETVDPSPTVWSPDGRWLVYSKVVGPGDQIFIAASDGSSPPTRIGDPDTINWSPIFSPDDAKILYFRGDSARGGHGPGRFERPATEHDRIRRRPVGVWHPDGNRVVVSAATTRRPTSGSCISTEHPNDSCELPGRAEVGPSWSPDGNRLVYLISVDPQGFMPVVADADGTNARTLPGVYGEINPAWSPDGRLDRGRQRPGSRRVCRPHRSGRPTRPDPDRERRAGRPRDRRSILPSEVAASRALSQDVGTEPRTARRLARPRP